MHNILSLMHMDFMKNYSLLHYYKFKRKKIVNGASLCIELT
jgi:hypothetical protein